MSLYKNKNSFHLFCQWTRFREFEIKNISFLLQFVTIEFHQILTLKFQFNIFYSIIIYIFAQGYQQYPNEPLNWLHLEKYHRVNYLLTKFKDHQSDAYMGFSMFGISGWVLSPCGFKIAFFENHVIKKFHKVLGGVV